MADTIFRDPTDEEKKSGTVFLNPTGNTQMSVFEKFREKIVGIQQKHTKDMTPFCFRCARLDFQDEIKKQMDEFGRGEGYLSNEKDLNIKIPSNEQLEKTYGESRFKLEGEKDAMDTTVEAGRKTLKKIGVYRDFKCKVRGCGVSVFVPDEKVDKENKKEK